MVSTKLKQQYKYYNREAGTNKISVLTLFDLCKGKTNYTWN